MKLTKEGKSTVERLHLTSGLGKEASRTFFESLLIQLILDYLDEEETYLPFIGKVKIDYLYDRYEGDTKKAVLDIQIEPDDNLARNIGQIEDGDQCDIEELLSRRVQGSLEEHFEKKE